MIVAAASVTNPRESLHPVLQGKFRIACPADPHPTAAPKDYSPFYQDFVLDRCITIARMQKQLTDIRPFYHDSTSAHWKKVLDWSDFPILSPGSETPVKIYGHFLWGWNDTHYFVAVPGRVSACRAAGQRQIRFHLLAADPGDGKDPAGYFSAFTAAPGSDLRLLDRIHQPPDREDRGVSVSSRYFGLPRHDFTIFCSKSPQKIIVSDPRKHGINRY